MIPITCRNCKNYIDDRICDAFPEVIPEVIWSGDNFHLEPLPGQDNDIVFEPIEKEETEQDFISSSS